MGADGGKREERKGPEEGKKTLKMPLLALVSSLGRKKGGERRRR